MKRILSFFLILLLLLPAVGCSTDNIEAPVNFYYIRKNYDFTGDSGVLAPEVTDAAQYASLNSFISAYLRGPNNLALTSPFPVGTLLIDATDNNDALIITLSDNFASLTGIELSLACCALAKTVMEFTGASVVEFHTIAAMLDGENVVKITHDDIILFDYATVSALDIEN